MSEEWICSSCGDVSPTDAPCASDGGARSPRAGDALLGTMIGRYRVARQLGSGATGTVYLAVHLGIRSQVAAKVLHREVCRDPDLVARFERAARATNRVHSDGVAKILDLGRTVDDRPAAIMEYVPGTTLSIHFASAAPLGSHAVGCVVASALRALEAVHRAGVVHRDIKPSNIQLTPGGYAILLDFGIALLSPAVLQPLRKTQTGALLGSPYYLSPELARGEPAAASTDIYSMGAVLFEGLTGVPPFASENLYELLRRHVGEPVPSIGNRPDASRWDPVIARAMAKLPGSRYPDARSMRLAVEAAAGIARPKHSPN